ncbi:MAG: 2'-deoxycytidine 5'-triphosphate deaminase, partial [Rhodospirillaceae bacterium]|nr:2'-deoxycytidine 5'-triphosphate deaminase [Rhodospirillaceae bacterium]
MTERVGVLSSTAIAALIERGEVAAEAPVGAPQIQPASLDLRLGPKAYRVRASFLPGRESVSAKIARLGMHEIDLTRDAVLERGCVYIVPLMERLALAPDVAAHANPKSSTGRLDIFTR